MSREDVFLVRHSSLPPIAEAVADRAIMNRLGMQIVIDFFTQLSLSGLSFAVQAGEEDAGFTMTGAIDDQLAAILIDQTAGALIPLRYEMNPGVVAAATLAMAMLELDLGKVRYSSGGTAYVPRNLNSQSAAGAVSGITAYVAGASDIVAAAKSAGTASQELGHLDIIENALADTIGYPGAWQRDVWNVRLHPMRVAHGAVSLIGHAGSASADLTGYARVEFAQLSVAQVAI